MKKPTRKKSAPRKPVRSTTLDQAVPEAPTPIVALSMEVGTFIAVFTALDSPEPTEFRFAINKPFNKAITAPASKCHQASGRFRDEKEGRERRATVAFVPTPKGATAEGTVHYRAKIGRHECFFSSPTQRLDTLDKETLKKLLFVLNTQFRSVFSAALPPSHELVTAATKLETLRASADEWTHVQAQVKQRLAAKDGPGALALLEPLVYRKSPMPAAEKLLGEMLLRAKRKNRETTSDEGGGEAVESLMIARLLLEYGLVRAQLTTPG